ncbi:flagellar assembly protein FliW [Paenibacillus sp. SAFN-117]|uniref:flagellar assembly protein FliW n=1 Tax=Paenibacillus sp. SAFN-117 TaxID=3436860 RepID=UPI001244FAAB|nr:flagellar assembly protein FliW [Aneurinibacillus sp. XH2]
MKLSTVRLGELEIQEDQLIYFKQGLPGFEHLRQFVILQPDEQIPFSYLQSVEDGNISFIIADPFMFYPEYSFELPESTREELEIEDEKVVQVAAIISVREQLESATINLQAPLVINTAQKLGKQVILHDSAYKPKHALIRNKDEMGEG